MKRKQTTQAVDRSTALIVATYNIHRCIGRDGRRDPERIARVLRETGADLIALQEVESFFEGEAGSHQLDYLSQATELHALSGPTILRSDSHYGNALLTRVPCRQLHHHDLSVPNCEPRGAMEGIFDMGGAPLRVIATHLGIRAWERDHQAERLLEILAKQNPQPTVMLGDFNEWFYYRPSMRKIRQMFSYMPRLATYPSRWPLLALDRIGCSPTEMLVQAWVHRSPLAQNASDHLPLLARLDRTRTRRP